MSLYFLSSDLHLSNVLYGNPFFFNKGTKSFLKLEHLDIFLYINKESFLQVSFIAYELKTNFKMFLTMVFFGGWAEGMGVWVGGGMGGRCVRLKPEVL